MGSESTVEPTANRTGGKVRRLVRHLVTSRSGAVVILLFGISIGWWAGSFTACADKGCEVRVDSIEALGTWVGGLGTITAVYWAAATYRREETLRRESVEREDRLRREDLERAERLRREDIERDEIQRREAAERSKLSEAQQMELFTAEANEVILRAQVGGGSDSYVDNLLFHLDNNAITTSVFKAECEVDGWPPLTGVHELPSGKTHTWEYRAKPGVPNLPAPIAHANWREWEAEMLATATVTWTMNGRRWTRTGGGPAELVS